MTLSKKKDTIYKNINRISEINKKINELEDEAIKLNQEVKEIIDATETKR